MTRDDHKHLIQFGLALVGAAALLGSVVGAVYGACRDVVGCWCAEEGCGEP